MWTPEGIVRWYLHFFCVCVFRMDLSENIPENWQWILDEEPGQRSLMAGAICSSVAMPSFFGICRGTSLLTHSCHHRLLLTSHLLNWSISLCAMGPHCWLMVQTSSLVLLFRFFSFCLSGPSPPKGGGGCPLQFFFFLSVTEEARQLSSIPQTGWLHMCCI